MKTILNIKTDKKLKEEARKVAKKLGLPLSTVVNSFLRQFVRDKEVTFSAKTYQMTPYLEEIAREAREDYKNGKTDGPFETVDELMDHLNS